MSEQTRLAGMRFVRAWPIDSLILLYLSPGDAVVIGDSAPRRAPQFIEYLFDTRVSEIASTSQARRKFTHDLDVGFHLRRRRICAAATDHAAFKVCHRAFFFSPHRRGQDYVGHPRGLRKEEIAGAKKV